jgi:hypothetical protein
MGHRAYNRCVLCEGDVGRVPSRGGIGGFFNGRLKRQPIAAACIFPS